MVRGGSLRASRGARGGFTVLSLAVLAAGLVLFLQGRGTSDGAGVASSGPRDPDLASYGQRIAVPPAAVSTARKFIQAAVLRKDLRAGWALAAPSLRRSVTRREWLRGTLPVMPSQPYVFRQVSFTPVRSRERDVLLLVNREYFVELVPSGGRWLVSYWAPRGHTGPVPAVP
jgi:hypothetical protein